MDNGSLRVLLVEENEEAAMLLRADLDDDDAPVRMAWRSAGTLKEAIAGLHDADVVLLALDLPDSHGLDTLRAVRSASPETPVVVLESRIELEAAVQALRAGAQDVLLREGEDVDGMARRLRFAVERERAQHRLAPLVARAGEGRGETREGGEGVIAQRN